LSVVSEFCLAFCENAAKDINNADKLQYIKAIAKIEMVHVGNLKYWQVIALLFFQQDV
jgi:hypothetical protein